MEDTGVNCSSKQIFVENEPAFSSIGGGTVQVVASRYLLLLG